MATPHDAFTLISEPHHESVFKDYEGQGSARYPSIHLALLASIRNHHPKMTVTVTLESYTDLLDFAAAGYADAELDMSEDDAIRFRLYQTPMNQNDPGALQDVTAFARYKYHWSNLEFIVYAVKIGYQSYEYVLFPPDDDEDVLSNSKATDALLMAVGQVQFPYKDYIYVFDNYWRADNILYQEVQKTTWSDVILDQEKKDVLTHTIGQFFDSKQRYLDLDCPWKRGLIFFGPPGNGKTLSLRALMHSLSKRVNAPRLLYVKNVEYIYQIGRVFEVARLAAPCLLILEDIDTIVRPGWQSYFFNEVDGLENNDGILMIATTNHLDRLDDGLAHRPSRFDRKYEFKNPRLEERVQYSEYWRKKLSKKSKVEFPEELSPEIAKITDGFSFAYLKEAFVSALLALARKDDATEKTPLRDLPLWIEIQREIKLLRKDLEHSESKVSDTVNTMSPSNVNIDVHKDLPPHFSPTAFQDHGLVPPWHTAIGAEDPRCVWSPSTQSDGKRPGSTDIIPRGNTRFTMQDRSRPDPAQNALHQCATSSSMTPFPLPTRPNDLVSASTAMPPATPGTGSPSWFGPSIDSGHLLPSRSFRF